MIIIVTNLKSVFLNIITKALCQMSAHHEKHEEASERLTKSSTAQKKGQLIWMDLINLGSEAKIRNSIPLSPDFVFVQWSPSKEGGMLCW